MQLKRQGVVLAGLKPEMYFYCGYIDKVFQERLGREFVVTNAVYPRGYKSFHPLGLAVDGRTLYWFDWTTHQHWPVLEQVCRDLQAELGLHGYDVVLEPDWLTREQIIARFSERQREELIGRADPQAVTDEQLDLLRRQIRPHLHAEFDPKPGETLWAEVD